ncbi:MAG: hypothetical protein C0631_15075 [Sedimenticola sp.]|nr:MAG: hypothetical protein C0631_15075 [Sedimenticola sp.]
MNDTKPKPSALLLISPQCTYCPAVMEGLTRLVKEGALGRLEIVNLFEHPEIAQKLGVRSVPWTRIGGFEIEGAQSYGELKRWAQQAADEGGMTDYYTHLLKSSQLDKVIERIRDYPATLLDLVLLAGSMDTPMNVRIGVGAVLEEFSGSDLLEGIVPELIRLTQSEDQQIRADACHYLSLTHAPESLEAVHALSDDPDPQVREIAMESAASLEAVLHQ